MGRFVAGRKFYITERGYMVWIPIASMEGDLVWRLKGCRIPFALRLAIERTRDVGRSGYHLIGDTYLCGIVNNISEAEMIGS
jgi:hypothetical protein